MRFGLLGLFSGVVAAVVASVLFAATSRSPEEAGSASAPGTLSVVVATAFIPAGTTLESAQISTRAAQPNLVPDGIVTDIQAAVGRTTLVPIFRNEPILQLRLSGDTPSPAGLVRPGRTVFALPAEAAHAAGGIIGSGDRIAIIGMLKSDNPAVVMQDITVLGVAGEAPFTSTSADARSGASSSNPLTAPSPSTRPAQKVLLLDVSLDQAAQLAALIDANKYYVALTDRSSAAGGARS